ncbi:interleukin-15 receptor subunit alpha isoform X1 [Periophthalmus magnuspinnatus]|uniref:interleukin-15 receptor subunit alpha isoform X1 n=1 Tax=Periophthalmus magnuspinnatus TaxID=409849 RepID=UPI00243671F7|nr:interleukin-15 receptor subunit alpha isoform X1 [Periophthalmus magnuspinnatus]
MDPGVLAPCPCMKRAFIGVYLLLWYMCYSADHSCPCADIPIPPHNLTKPPVWNCSNSNSFRYTCIDGYVRKVGTSNLIRCVDNKWTQPKLECIDDPKKARPKTTKSPTSFVTPSTISSVSSETHLETTSTAPPPQYTLTSPTSAVTSNVHVNSSETTSTFPPPQHTPDIPSTASSPLIPHSTSTISFPATTSRPSNVSRTTSPSSHSGNDTSLSIQETQSVVTSVLSVVILLIILAASAAGFWLYKRKSRNRTQRPHTERPISGEETIPMHQQNRNT